MRKRISLELLVVTLASTLLGRDADSQARIRLISDTVRNAPGLIAARFYRSRGYNTSYLMLTTWDDPESWQRAQERHNPKALLQAEMAKSLSRVPQQWLMSYLWGYNRPAAIPTVATAHLMHIAPAQVEFAQRQCIAGLRHFATQPMLASGILGRGAYEENREENSQNAANPPYQEGTFFLKLLSWSSEEEREDFYADPRYRTLTRLMSSQGTIQVLPLEPI
jgi:quinol monooxygenase YgiN